VGPDDRWTSAGGRWRPHQGIEASLPISVPCAANRAARNWDLRGRMGGSGSMRDWVYAGFAQNDHVHFTSIGYRRLSAVLVGDLMQQYEAFAKLVFPRHH
jgi:hypothetical protein